MVPVIEISMRQDVTHLWKCLAVLTEHLVGGVTIFMPGNLRTLASNGIICMSFTCLDNKILYN